MKNKPLILVTNDDGISAPGLRTLIKVMNTIGEVVVVAPDSPQSGMGHAITINSTLRCTKVDLDGGPQKEYACSGTPADCVKLGVHELLDRKPDLCVSGINHGSNAAINVIYSGTMSGAIEAGIEGIPAIGFSLLDYRWDADFDQITSYVEEIVRNALSHGIPEGVVLNVNFPKKPKSDIKGVKICRQAKAYWIEEFDSEILNEEYFSYEVGNGFFSNGQWVSGWGNNESQYYTSCEEDYSKFCNESTKATENTFIENGYLKIQPIYWNTNWPTPENGQQPFDDPYCQTNDCSSWGGTFDYTSGKLITRDKFSITYGNEVTVCFKVPEGSGHWPAFWMLPQGFMDDEKFWPRDGEIDLMEHMKTNQDNHLQWLQNPSR